MGASTIEEIEMDIEIGFMVHYMECTITSSSPPCYDQHYALVTRIHKKNRQVLDLVIVDNKGIRTVRNVPHERVWAKDFWKWPEEEYNPWG
jgi:hypothetical protein